MGGGGGGFETGREQEGKERPTTMNSMVNAMMLAGSYETRLIRTVASRLLEDDMSGERARPLKTPSLYSNLQVVDAQRSTLKNAIYFDLKHIKV